MMFAHLGLGKEQVRMMGFVFMVCDNKLMSRMSAEYPTDNPVS
jgi:hypothetical protein